MRGHDIFVGRAFPPPRGLDTVPRYGEASPKCNEGGKVRRDDGAPAPPYGTVSPALSPEGAQDRFQGGRAKLASIVATPALEDV